MLDGVAGLLTYQAANYLTTGHNPPRMGNAHASIVPYGTFETLDGQLMLAVGNDDQWRRFCAVADRPELASDERFSTNPRRVDNRTLLWPIVADILRTRRATIGPRPSGRRPYPAAQCGRSARWLRTRSSKPAA